ncbi:MAG: hypothetical protein WC602_05095 [archaeon]
MRHSHTDNYNVALKISCNSFRVVFNTCIKHPLPEDLLGNHLLDKDCHHTYQHKDNVADCRTIKFKVSKFHILSFHFLLKSEHVCLPFTLGGGVVITAAQVFIAPSVIVQ